MPRNKQDVSDRLQRAALALYGDQGYERTTTAEIAGRAGVTERTYFRHFADKREVLFGGEGALRAILVAGIAEASEALSPLDALWQAFRSLEPLMEENRPFSEPRQRIIAATPALQERELAKIASLTDGLAAALMDRGVERRTGHLAAKVGMAALVEAMNGWLEDGSKRFVTHLDAAFADLRHLSSSSFRISSEEDA